MHQVHERLFVGGQSICRSGDANWFVVHACKSPCHQAAVGYQGSLASDHPNYLLLEHADNLFMNIIDPPVPLLKLESFVAFLRNTHAGWQRGQNVLIHCNQGESRAPTLALLLMAKRLGALSNASYQSAVNLFTTIYPAYRPGRGIQTFMTQHWDHIP